MFKLTLQEKLKILRENNDMTQNDVAKVLNISRSTYSYYESGKNKPSLESIVILAKFYGITTDDILL